MYSINNPCNIRYSNNRWRGQLGSRHGFCYFSSLLYGYRAFLLLCRTYYNKYHINSVQAFIQKFAPSSENNTSAYIDFVVSRLAKHGLNNHFDLTRSKLYWLAYYVSVFENGYISAVAVDALNKAFDVYYSFINED